MILYVYLFLNIDVNINSILSNRKRITIVLTKLKSKGFGNKIICLYKKDESDDETDNISDISDNLSTSFSEIIITNTNKETKKDKKDKRKSKTPMYDPNFEELTVEPSYKTKMEEMISNSIPEMSYPTVY